MLKSVVYSALPCGDVGTPAAVVAGGFGAAGGLGAAAAAGGLAAAAGLGGAAGLLGPDPDCSAYHREHTLKPCQKYSEGN